MLVIVVEAPKAPTPVPVFVRVIPTTSPAVDGIPVIGVINSPSTAGAPVDNIVPDMVPVDTPDFEVIFGRGVGPQPRAMYEAYAGASPMRYFAIMFLPVLVIILYSYIFYYTSTSNLYLYLFIKLKINKLYDSISRS